MTKHKFSDKQIEVIQEEVKVLQEYTDSLHASIFIGGFVSLSTISFLSIALIK